MSLSPATIDYLADNGGRPALIAALRAEGAESAQERAQRRAAELVAEFSAALAPGFAGDFDRAAWSGAAAVTLSELIREV